jgi:pimeloyl-ACP methyl ester carboxylesterase
MNRNRTVCWSQLVAAFLLMVVAVFLTGFQPRESEYAQTASITGTAHVNGVDLYFEVYGDGEPLILLHGGLGHSGHWENQIPVLSERFKVIAVDSRGHGRSTMTEEPMSYALMASDVIALMDRLDISKTNVVGFSDGGNIGLHLAINHPKRLLKVVAAGANYHPSGVRPDVGEHPKMVGYFGTAAKDYEALSPDPAKWDALLQSISKMWASEPNFTAEELGGMAVPIMFLDGQSEEFIYPEHTREMARLIPTATLVLIPETGHFGLWEQPEEMNSAILEFLTK